MSKGAIYIMTTAVSGLIKISKTQVRQYQEEMHSLEMNGYYNVSGLKRQFAIKVDDYFEKGALLHEIFAKHRVGTSELFALDYDLVRQLLLSFEGEIVYPTQTNKGVDFSEIAKARQSDHRFSFYKKGLHDGDEITFIKDETIVARVAGERKVAYNGQIWFLSPLTRKIFEEKGQVNSSGAYQGAAYFCFEGRILKDLPDM